MINQILQDIPVLICRPEPSASELALALSAVGARCSKLPCLEIKPVQVNDADKQSLINLDQYHHVIVLSQHAASPALELIDAYWPQFPAQQPWYAVGRKTAGILSDSVPGLIEPEADLTSEDILALPALQDIKEQRVLILKGKGGRDTIQKGLSQRQAKVDVIELYERIAPEYDNATLNSILQGQSLRYIVALSAETLRNLVSFAEQIKLDLTQYHLILPSERVARVALQMGFQLTYIPNNLKPIDIIRCIANIEAELKREQSKQE